MAELRAAETSVAIWIGRTGSAVKQGEIVGGADIVQCASAKPSSPPLWSVCQVVLTSSPIPPEMPGGRSSKPAPELPGQNLRPVRPMSEKVKGVSFAIYLIATAIMGR